MTNAQPEDLETRVTIIEEQLNQMLKSLDLVRTIQTGVRVEICGNSQASATLASSHILKYLLVLQ